MVDSFERALVGELEGSHGDRLVVPDDPGHPGRYTTLSGSTPDDLSLPLDGGIGPCTLLEDSLGNVPLVKETTGEPLLQRALARPFEGTAKELVRASCVRPEACTTPT